MKGIKKLSLTGHANITEQISKSHHEKFRHPGFVQGRQGYNLQQG
jgi:hypothetical protein